MKMSLNVTTFNILSQKLANPKSYLLPDYALEILKPSFRLNLIKQKLSAETAKKSIIALQELSIQDSSELVPFLSQQGYQLITGMYGNQWNGFMGIGLAVPYSKFDIQTVEITRASDNMMYNRHPSPPSKPNFIVAYITSFIKKVLDYFNPPKQDPWVDASRRFNQYVFAQLREKETGQSFVVGTYHMPCMYKLPQVMVIHSALVATAVQKFAQKVHPQYQQYLAAKKESNNNNNESSSSPSSPPLSPPSLPYVLLGDFNFKPDSSMYQLYTQGQLEDSHPEKPIIPTAPGTNYCSLTVSPMKSAYQLHQGSEPLFTNYAKCMSDIPFSGTLDYIFLSPQWGVRSVVPLYKSLEEIGLMPNKIEPSDHLLLGAEIEILTN